jgi:hypothetical protein
MFFSIPELLILIVFVFYLGVWQGETTAAELHKNRGFYK